MCEVLNCSAHVFRVFCDFMYMDEGNIFRKKFYPFCAPDDAWWVDMVENMLVRSIACSKSSMLGKRYVLCLRICM